MIFACVITAERVIINYLSFVFKRSIDDFKYLKMHR